MAAGEVVAAVETDERADHHHVAVREVDQLQDAVHHGVPEGAPGGDRPRGYPVEEVLEKSLHEERKSPAKATRRTSACKVFLGYGVGLPRRIGGGGGAGGGGRARRPGG